MSDKIAPKVEDRRRLLRPVRIRFAFRVRQTGKGKPGESKVSEDELVAKERRSREANDRLRRGGKECQRAAETTK